MTMRRQWLAALLLTAIAVGFLLVHAVPRLEDGAVDIRHVHHAMQDEAEILDRTWHMVEKGGIRHGVAVYPSFYPYQVALIRWLTLGGEARESIVATRIWSMLVMVLALVVTTVSFGAAMRSPLSGGMVSSAMALSPEMVDWASRVHPDAWLLLLNHAALGAFTLGVDRKSARWLLAATACAGLSAATKLVGFFVMVPIALGIILDHDDKPVLRARALVRHLALFSAIFLVANPVIFTDGVQVLRGFAMQHRLNLEGTGGLGGWVRVLVGPDGWGCAGAVVVVLGMVSVLRRPERRFLPIVAFGLFYLAFLLFGVRLTEPRYAYPATWPLFAVSLAGLGPSRVGRRAAVALGVLVLGLYLSTDLPRQIEARRAIAHRYGASLTPDRVRIGAMLLGLGLGPEQIVVSSSSAFVPKTLRWLVVWRLSDLRSDVEVGALLIDDDLRKAGIEVLPEVQRDHGLVVTATVGRTWILVPRPPESSP